MSTQSAVIEQITPKQAAAWLDHNYEHNRPLSDKHVKFLAREMELGRFTLATIHFMYVGNTVHLVNGQHTLHAIAQSGKAQTCVVIREHGCTDADLPKVFMHYDIQRKRTFMDSVRAFKLDEKMGVAARWVDRVASAIKYGKSGFGSMNGVEVSGHRDNPNYLAVSDLFDLVPRWETEIKLISSAIEGGSRDVTSGIQTAKVLSVALITAYYQPDKAAQFWNNVAFDDGLNIGDPQKTLSKYLLKTRRSIGGRLGAEPIPSNVVSRAVAHCWNAYFEDRLYSRVTIRGEYSTVPIVLAGTPYSGNQSPTFWPLRNQERIAA